MTLNKGHLLANRYEYWWREREGGKENQNMTKEQTIQHFLKRELKKKIGIRN